MEPPRPPRFEWVRWVLGVGGFVALEALDAIYPTRDSDVPNFALLALAMPTPVLQSAAEVVVEIIVRRNKK